LLRIPHHGVFDSGTLDHAISHPIGEALRPSYRHCDDVGRDPAEIEVTAMLGVAPGASADEILQAAGRTPRSACRRS
jgi:hypothetical protein